MGTIWIMPCSTDHRAGKRVGKSHLPRSLCQSRAIAHMDGHPCAGRSGTSGLGRREKGFSPRTAASGTEVRITHLNSTITTGCMRRAMPRPPAQSGPSRGSYGNRVGTAVRAGSARRMLHSMGRITATGTGFRSLLRPRMVAATTMRKSIFGERKPDPFDNQRIKPTNSCSRSGWRWRPVRHHSPRAICGTSWHS